MVGFRMMVAAAALMAAGAVSAAPTAAKKADCGHQAAVVAAIQQARLDRVKERDVGTHLADSTAWPEQYNTAIPLLTPWVYEMKMREIRDQDLGAAWTELCLQQ